MSSTTQQPPTTVPALLRLGCEAQVAMRAFADALALDPTLLALLPDESLEAVTLTMLSALDAAQSSTTVLTGRVDRFIGAVRGKLIAGKYLSTTQFLVAEGGLSLAAARAMVAQGRALHRDYTQVADAWLAGRVTSSAIKALTSGVEEVLRRAQRSSTQVRRDLILADLMPHAEARNLALLEAEVKGKIFEVDPDGCDEAALFAFENQSLSIVENGSMWRITGDLTPEAAAATRTVLEAAANQIAVEELGDLDHDDDCDQLLTPGGGCTCGELDRARRAKGLTHQQLMARALGEHMHDQLDAGGLGSHHGVARHLTIVGDITDATKPLIGRLAMPGLDEDVLLPPATMGRLLCDSDITRVLTAQAQLPLPDPDAIDDTVDADVEPDPAAHSAATAPREDSYLQAVVTTLTAMARTVLYVGRDQRTVSVRLRKALVRRDGHCVFPGCRAHARRCEAHHVVPWEQGGPTTIDNLALLCVAHHHAVHEGGWTMALKPGYTGHETGCWAFTAPPLRRRRLGP
jgi:hypothetical protein